MAFHNTTQGKETGNQSSEGRTEERICFIKFYKYRWWYLYLTYFIPEISMQLGTTTSFNYHSIILFGILE